MNAQRLEHHDVVILTQERIRLYCEEAFRHLYLYQELLIAQCPVCKQDVLGWIGIDDFGQESDLVRIKPKRHARWLLRAERESFAVYYPAGVDVVLGSKPILPFNLRTVLVK